MVESLRLFSLHYFKNLINLYQPILDNASNPKVDYLELESIAYNLNNCNFKGQIVQKNS